MFVDDKNVPPIADRQRTQVASPTAKEERFGFGTNWSRFLRTLSDAQVRGAEESLREMLCARSLTGKSLLDIGSGSGLFSLAARRLGAKVHSFDYDVGSVACTERMRRRYFPADSEWVVEQGSVLDEEYVQRLGKFDVVYSWGVLHHTGEMWRALDNAAALVADNGQLFIAIYNDQGLKSKYWKVVKRTYNRSRFGKILMLVVHMPYLYGLRALVRHVTRRAALGRGMSLWHDAVDWIGGYPFEVAKPEQVVEFLASRGLVLRKLRTCGGKMGCNEFVFSMTRINVAKAG